MPNAELASRCQYMLGLFSQCLMTDGLIIIKIIPRDDNIRTRLLSKAFQSFLLSSQVSAMVKLYYNTLWNHRHTVAISAISPRCLRTVS